MPIYCSELSVSWWHFSNPSSWWFQYESNDSPPQNTYQSSCLACSQKDWKQLERHSFVFWSHQMKYINVWFTSIEQTLYICFWGRMRWKAEISPKKNHKNLYWFNLYFFASIVHVLNCRSEMNCPQLYEIFSLCSASVHQSSECDWRSNTTQLDWWQERQLLYCLPHGRKPGDK